MKQTSADLSTSSPSAHTSLPIMSLYAHLSVIPSILQYNRRSIIWNNTRRIISSGSPHPLRYPMFLYSALLISVSRIPLNRKLFFFQNCFIFKLHCRFVLSYVIELLCDIIYNIVFSWHCL